MAEGDPTDASSATDDQPQLRSRPSLGRCLGLSVVVALLTGAIAVFPRLLVTSGTAWSPGQLQWVYVGTVIAALIVTFLAYFTFTQWRKLLGRDPGSSGDGLAPLGVITAVLVAVLAIAHQLASVPVGKTSRPTCTGVQVHHVPYVAATFGTGLNVRSGPGLKFLQIARFDARCTIGAMGYCRGEPIFDTLLPVRDDRWLILPHREGYVSAAAVFGLTAEDSLPDIGCRGELPATPVTSLNVTTMGSTPYSPLRLTAVSQDAPNVGIALLRPAFQGEARFRQLVLDVDPRLDRTAVTYLPALDHDVVSAQRVVYAVAVPCRAAGIPAEPQDAQLVGIDVKTGIARPLKIRPTEYLKDLLRTACRYASGDPIPIINGPNREKP